MHAYIPHPASFRHLAQVAGPAFHVAQQWLEHLGHAICNQAFYYYYYYYMQPCDISCPSPRLVFPESTWPKTPTFTFMIDLGEEDEVGGVLPGGVLGCGAEAEGEDIWKAGRERQGGLWVPHTL